MDFVEKTLSPKNAQYARWNFPISQFTHFNDFFAEKSLSLKAQHARWYFRFLIAQFIECRKKPFKVKVESFFDRLLSCSDVNVNIE